VAEEAARAALAGAARQRPQHALPAAAELAVTLADDRELRRLNRQWRGQDKPTNVLSFPSGALDSTAALPPDMPVPLGDVVLGLETCAREAAAAGLPLAHHLEHLVVHGVLHLLGYDHETDGEAEAMERLESAVLAARGIADPYADAARAAETCR